jgi:RNA polymerase sigma factor (sigma-70 family)
VTITPDVGHLLRDLAPQVLGAVARRHGDFAAAEDVVQEALIAAAEQWPKEGIPANPRGWLYHVAIRRMTDHLRGEIARRKREDSVAAEVWADWAFVPSPDRDIPVDEDDTLVLLFMCCHPALSQSSAIALTLRAVGGLTTAEIASAFLVPEATMAQRISRAKQTIKSSDIPFSMPSDNERDERLSSVLHVLYLIFNEGYTTTAGENLNRTDLSDEAIRLTRMLRSLLPKDAEVIGLLALMLLTDARRAARTGPIGELIPLDEQNRKLWDRKQIAEGIALISQAFSMGEIGPYQIQAAIAAVHDRAATSEDTNWDEIVRLYDLLKQMSDNPMVALSHAVAWSMVHGPEAGIEILKNLGEDPRISSHYRLDAVRAHLYERLGDKDAAAKHYRAAAAGTTSIPERNYLMGKLLALKSAVS